MRRKDFIKLLVNKTMVLEGGEYYNSCAGAERTINSVLECGNRQYPKQYMGVKTDAYELDISRNNIKKSVTIRWHDKTYMEAINFRLSFDAFDDFCCELEEARNAAEKAYFFKRYAGELDDMVRQAKEKAVAEERKRTSQTLAKPWGDTLD